MKTVFRLTGKMNKFLQHKIYILYFCVTARGMYEIRGCLLLGNENINVINEHMYN